MPSFVIENMAPILLETPRSGPPNLYILHKVMVLTTTYHPPDYRTFSGGQAVCPLPEVTGPVLQLTLS